MPIVIAQQAGSNLFCYALLAVIGGVVAFVFIQYVKTAEARTRERQAAFDAYQSELAKLKANPTDPNIKQRALQLGRTYANHTRQQKGVTVFDEVALSNDISAATAAATVAQPAQPPPIAQPTSLADRMRKLNELRDAGLITDIEYAE